METMVEKDSMVLKVAKAMWERHKGSDQRWETLGAFWTETYLEKARAAIEAMRPANSAVLQAVSKYAYEGWGDPETIALQAWQDGIDAALSESMKEK